MMMRRNAHGLAEWKLPDKTTLSGLKVNRIRRYKHNNC
jgi:hypothetical protein